MSRESVGAWIVIICAIIAIVAVFTFTNNGTKDIQSGETIRTITLKVGERTQINNLRDIIYGGTDDENCLYARILVKYDEGYGDYTLDLIVWKGQTAYAKGRIIRVDKITKNEVTLTIIKG